jgi:PTH2 family peptidyl-tRNA hydrolase
MSLNHSEPTMVFIARKDLKLSAGKLAVQCSHAAVSCVLAARKTEQRLLERWNKNGGRKICLQVESLSTLQIIAGQAQAANLITHLVKDAGHTEVPPGTITVLGIGPGPRRSIDALVQDLKPY